MKLYRFLSFVLLELKRACLRKPCLRKYKTHSTKSIKESRREWISSLKNQAVNKNINLNLIYIYTISVKNIYTVNTLSHH